MKVVVQRCSSAAVSIQGETVGQIGQGLMLLVGLTHEDAETDIRWMADKIAGLRIFEDQAGKMNLSVREAGGAILSVSQFTLYGDTRKGRRPTSWRLLVPSMQNRCMRRSMPPCGSCGLQVETGRFGAMMEVALVNSGPVTLIVDSKE